MAAQPGTRLAALDLLRGAAVAGMILVNSPGDWGYVYAPLLHADWNGWTPTDLIFPTFLFAVGVALGLSFPRPGTPADRGAYRLRVLRRVAALIILGLLLEATYNAAIALGAPFFGHASLGHMRLPGVLQRIALCYALVATLLAVSARRGPDDRLHIRAGAVALAIAAVLAGYWALLQFVPVPGFGAGRLDPEGSLPAFVDRAVFTPAHLWWLGWATPGGPPVYDPEGLLSTLPAATNTLFGVLAAVAWRRDSARAPLLIGAAGAVLIVAGLALNPLFPINKRIWTSSFALLSSGWAALFFVGLGLAARVAVLRGPLWPLRVLGGNAILAFCISTLFGRLYAFPLIPHADGPLSLSAWMQATATGLLGNPDLASLACALIVVAGIVLLIAPLNRRGLHLRL